MNTPETGQTRPHNSMAGARPVAGADAPSPWDDLLDAARSGDEEALGRLCDEFREYLLLLASSELGAQVRPKLAASDIVQQSMLEACRDFDSFRGESAGEFRAWLKRLVAHNLVDASRRYRVAQRRQAARERSIDAEGTPISLEARTRSPSTLVRQRETDEELLRAIARLPDSRRRVVELRHREGMSYADIGHRLGINESTARKHWSRAIQTLRDDLASDDDEPTQRRSPR